MSGQADRTTVRPALSGASNKPPVHDRTLKDAGRTPARQVLRFGEAFASTAAERTACT